MPKAVYVLLTDNEESCCDYSSHVGGTFQTLKGALRAIKDDAFHKEGTCVYPNGIVKFRGGEMLATYDNEGKKTWQRTASTT